MWRLYIRCWATAPQKCFDVAPLQGLPTKSCNHFLKLRTNLKILLYKFFGFTQTNACATSKSKSTLSVQDSEVYCFGGVTHFFGNVFWCNALDEGRSFGMNIAIIVERLDHQFIAAHRRSNTEFELAVISTDKDLALACNEPTPNPFAKFGAHWYVLQIRIDGTKTASGGNCKVKRRVDAVVGIYKFWQRINIG